jgi:threonine aldolase
MVLSRRELVQTFGTAASLAWFDGPGGTLEADVGALAADDHAVLLSGDGIGLSPRAYTALLDDLARKAEIREDNYLLGGEVERFEQHWATLLGKEMAVFMPSGTLANQLALRALAGTKRRVTPVRRYPA